MEVHLVNDGPVTLLLDRPKRSLNYGKENFLPLFFIIFFSLWVHLRCPGLKRAEGDGDERDQEPAVAGMFYPDQPDILSRDVKKFLEGAKKEKIEGDVVALLSPHAGYMYSGRWLPVFIN